MITTLVTSAIVAAIIALFVTHAERYHELSVPIAVEDPRWTPEKMSDHAAGWDLRAALPKPYTLEPHMHVTVPTGVRIALRPGYEAQIRPRSGLASTHGVSCLLGTIDADYRGVIHVILFNHSEFPYIIQPGDRIAQLVVTQLAPVLLSHQSTLPPSRRGEQGLGSTGVA
jgi:dUTP pyrophosphatase